MAILETDDVVLVGMVALLHGWQLALAANEVGKFRRKHKISPPLMEGPPQFIRALRAQQNCVEFAVTFQAFLWLSGLFFHQVPTAILGLVYVYVRHSYVKGYIEDAERRVPPFWISVRILKALTGLALIGMINTLMRSYLGIDSIQIMQGYLFTTYI